jgi:hypothetical protein
VPERELAAGYGPLLRRQPAAVVSGYWGTAAVQMCFDRLRPLAQPSTASYYAARDL